MIVSPPPEEERARRGVRVAHHTERIEHRERVVLNHFAATITLSVRVT